MKKFALFLFLVTLGPMTACSDDDTKKGTPVPDFELPEMKWTTYDWEITKTTVSGMFELDGRIPAGATLEVNCYFGENEDALKPIAHTVTDKWNYKYSTERLTGLEPGTTYLMRIEYGSKEAKGGGQQKSLTKQVKTMSDYSGFQVDQTVTPVNHKIEWATEKEKPTGLKSISPANIFAAYPRLVHVDNGTIACVYHGGTIGTPFLAIYMQTSTDDGATWSEARELLSVNDPKYAEVYKRFINPEILRLQNGSFLLSVTAIGAVETNENCHTLALISEDGCKTWSEPVIVGRGRSWEPMVVQLPNGELELLVSSEAQWWQVINPLPQEILCARSTDNGRTWTKYIRACYSPDRRDGMPSAVVLQGNKGVLFSIEVINHNGYGSPSLVHRALDGEWDPIPWRGQASDSRWHIQMALNNGSTDGAAPYTIQLTTGEVVVMAQVNPKNSIWQTAYPRIAICDNTGHGWSDASKSTPVGAMPNNEGFYYGSLFQKDDNTIWLAATHCSYSGTMAEWSQIKFLKGTIVRK